MTPPTFLGSRDVGPLTFSAFSSSILGLVSPTPLRSTTRSLGSTVPKGDSLIRVHVEIERGGKLKAVNEIPTLDSEEGWRLYHQPGGEPRIVMHPPRFDRPVWEATVATPVVRIRCDDSMCISLGPDDGAIVNPLTYPLDLLIGMHVLAGHGRGAIIHAAGLKLDKDHAVIFPGRSGAGKSTLSRLFRSGTLLSDDRVIVDTCLPQPLVWGTPWAGDAGIVSDDWAPLSAICFPVKGKAMSLRKLTVSEALDRLLITVSIPWYDETLSTAVLDLCGRVLEKVSAYDLTFTREDDPGPLIRECLGVTGAGEISGLSDAPNRGEVTPAP